jgi:hypothetical protein
MFLTCWDESERTRNIFLNFKNGPELKAPVEDARFRTIQRALFLGLCVIAPDQTVERVTLCREIIHSLLERARQSGGLASELAS